MNNTIRIPSLTVPILVAVITGFFLGLFLHYLTPFYDWIQPYVVDTVLAMGGQIFLRAIQMVVVPLVITSLIIATNSLQQGKQFGRISLKTLGLYILTTTLAVTLALSIAQWFSVGNIDYTNEFDQIPVIELDIEQHIEDSNLVTRLIPNNLVSAMAEGQMLPIIIGAILLGIAINTAGSAGQRITAMTQDLYQIILRLLALVLYYSPIGIFCLIAQIFASHGFELMGPLVKYGTTMIFVLFLHLTILTVVLLYLFSRLNPWTFYRKMSTALMVAFSTSSSSATLPLTLNSVEKKLGVRNEIASFTIPLGATINMDGGAILQGMAVVFIANAFQIDLSLLDYLIIIVTVILATIGTAGVPGAGITTMALVFTEIGLPIEGIALIIALDRLLEMFRTMTNITGDALVTCAVAHSENMIDRTVYNAR